MLYYCIDCYLVIRFTTFILVLSEVVFVGDNRDYVVLKCFL